MATVVDWLACDTVSGEVLAELLDLRAEGSLEMRLGDASTTDLSLPIPLGGVGAPPNNWVDATSPQGWRRMIVAVLAGEPIWAGTIVRRRRGTDATARLATVTLEGYLDKRYVGDHTWSAQDEASVIGAGLIGDANTSEGISLTVDAPATGTLRDRIYLATDDRTVLSALQSLMGVSGGPEWTIGLSWNATQTAVIKTFTMRPRIGFATTEPVAVFSSAGDASARYDLEEDYTDGRGANHVVATSSGEGDTRPQSSAARDEDLIALGPRVECRFTPSTSTSATATLDAHAQQALALMAQGARVWQISARADADPVLGRDWVAGDDIGYDLTGHGHPQGVTGVARAIGWRLDPHAGVVVPLLLTPGDEVIA